MYKWCLVKPASAAPCTNSSNFSAMPRSHQNLGRTVKTSASRVIFSRRMNGGENRKPLVHYGFSHLVLFWKDFQSCNRIAISYVFMTGHSFDFENAEILCQESNWRKIKLLEALHIELTPNTCHLHKGKSFDNNWLTFLKYFNTLDNTCEVRQLQENC